MKRRSLYLCIFLHLVVDCIQPINCAKRQKKKESHKNLVKHYSQRGNQNNSDRKAIINELCVLRTIGGNYQRLVIACCWIFWMKIPSQFRGNTIYIVGQWTVIRPDRKWTAGKTIGQDKSANRTSNDTRYLSQPYVYVRLAAHKGQILDSTQTNAMGTKIHCQRRTVL